MTTPTYCSNTRLDFRPQTAVRVIRKAGALAAVALGICAATVSAQASVLAGWDMSGLAGGSGNYGPSPFAPNNTDANLTVGGLTRGSGVGTSGSGAAKAWGGNAFNVTSESAAISGNLFATFTITPKPGWKVSFSNIAAYNIRRSSTGPTTGIWQYQIGSGAFTDIGSSITWGSNTSSTGNAQGSVNLSGISALQNVPAGTTVTIRIVNWNASGSSGTWYFNGQGTTPNLTFNGTVDPLDVPPDAPVANDPGSVTSSAFAANWSSSVGATGYRLDVSTSSAFDSFVAGYNDLDAGNVTSSAVTGLSANTTYYYRVRAYNASGTSGNSNVKSATTSGSVAATKMTVTLPGQPAANTGTPTPQTAGSPFNVTLTAVLNDGTTVDTTYSGSRNIAFSGPSGSPVYPASVTFNSGVGVASIVLNKAEDTTLTATDSLLTGIASSTFSVTPAIYHWIASGSDSWTNAASWSPARVSPGADDTLLFDQGGASTATDVPSQTIVSLQVSNNTSITLQAAGSVTLNLAGGVNAFAVGSGSALTASGSGAVTISLPSGSSATISGAITFAGGGHRLLAVDGGSVTFQTGSTFTADTGFGGNAFGTANLNTIVFASGSTYIQKAGSNPFGASQPSSVVTFQTGSLYRVAANTAPSFSGRTYADLEINAPAFNQSATGGGVLTMDNLNIVSGTLNLNLTGGIHIKGNVTVAAGQTLAFSPASIGGVSFNGSAPQTISGGGTINFGANSSVSVPSGSTLLVDTGVGTASGATLTVDGTLGGNSSITGAGIVTINPDGVLAPGASIGTLTFDTAPSLQGSTSLDLDRNASPNADQIALTGGSLNFGGSLVLTNAGAALADGDSFTLFTASGFNGWFNDVIAPSLASGLTLDTNKLSQTGILDVYAFTAGGSVPLSVVKNVAADLPLTTVFAHTTGGRGALALAAATGASHGVIATNDTTITYTPDANYVGSDSFICSVADTNNGIANVTVAVTVTGSGGGNTSTLAIQQSGTNFSVTVTGNAGSSYQLQRSAALSPTNWQPVGSVFTMPVSGSTNISVTPAGNTGFYRTVIP